jgi:hypothetical protein
MNGRLHRGEHFRSAATHTCSQTPASKNPLPRTRLLFSFEPGQELTKRFRAGPFGASLRRIVTASEPNRKRPGIAADLPSPSPRIGVWLLYDDIVSSGFHATSGDTVPRRDIRPARSRETRAPGFVRSELRCGGRPGALPWTKPWRR